MSKTIDDIFPADKDLVVGGVWFEIATRTVVEEGVEKKLPVRLLIDRIDCEGFVGFREFIQKQNEYQIQHDTLDADTKAKLLIPGVAKHLLKGWENWPPEKPIEYSVEAATTQLKERSTMYVAVMQMAAKTAAFVKQKNAQTVKP